MILKPKKTTFQARLTDLAVEDLTENTLYTKVAIMFYIMLNHCVCVCVCVNIKTNTGSLLYTFYPFYFHFRYSPLKMTVPLISRYIITVLF